MQLSPGVRLGQYTIVSAIGSGGMGEVYRARDTKLDRTVAIKVLPDLLATDPDRLARFEREAKTLASLNHPNIAQIYGQIDLPPAGGSQNAGVGRSHVAPEGGSHSVGLVMELVEGETLAERIARGPIPLDEALPIARQITDALEAAHDCGIIHRDLKPANIKVRPDGTVKVLDFGLAKAVEAGFSRPSEGPAEAGPYGSANSPTFASPAVTGMGVILGTAAYMSPEQARGKPVDARADIWAFGVTLYEMLSGKALFSGATVSDVLASILRDGPNWDSLPADTPSSVRRLLHRCLQRDPQLRLRHAGDARLELVDVDYSTGPATGVGSGGLSWKAAALLGVGIAAVSAAIALLVLPRFSGTTELPVRKWIIPQESGDDLFGRENISAISPDGARVAYTDGLRLRIRELASLDTLEVPGPGVAGTPVWSPDGSHVAYFIDHKSLWKAPASGGTPTKICDLPPGVVFGIAWKPDRTIVVNMAYGPAAGELFTVPEGGGRPQRFKKEDAAATAIFFVSGLPNGSLIYGRRGKDGTFETVVERPGQPGKVLPISPNSGVTYASGHLLYSSRESPGIWAVPFDLSTGSTTGEPFRIAAGGVGPSASEDGTLAYGRRSPGLRQLTWFDRDGMVRGAIGQPQDSMHHPAISPDGTRVAVAGVEKGVTNIWIHEMNRAARSRVTFGAVDVEPAWHPTDGRIAFTTANWDVFTANADGGAEPKVFLNNPMAEFHSLWSRDGRHFVYTQYSPKTQADVWTIQEGGERKAVVETPFNEMMPTLSPDGQFIAYVSDETGENEVFVRTFPGGQGKRQVSSNGGRWPKWRGREIFFIEKTTLMSAAVRTEPTLQVDVAKPLFKVEERSALFGIYDTIDGQRFIVVRTIKPSQNGIAIVQNWLAEFKKVTPDP